jgi:hypothetical protein
MRVLVCGGRKFNNAKLLNDRLTKLIQNNLESHPFGVSFVIHGGATGADSLAGKWAKARGITVLEFPADWLSHGRSAGPIRNAKMLREGNPDLVLAMPGGTGTADMIRKAKAAGVPVVEVTE